MHSDQVSIGVRGQEVDKFQQSSSSGLAIRVVSEARLGFAYVIGGDQQGIERAVAEALASAAASDPEPEFSLAGPVETCRRLRSSTLSWPPTRWRPRWPGPRSWPPPPLAADPRVVHVQPAEFLLGG